MATDDERSVVIVSHDERLKEVADRVLWLEDGSFRELASLVTDPVCGMQVTPGGGTPHRLHGADTWWFCSSACADEFVADADRFATSRP